MSRRASRRRYLQLAAAAGVVGLAGCAREQGEGEEQTDAGPQLGDAEEGERGEDPTEGGQDEGDDGGAGDDDPGEGVEDFESDLERETIEVDGLEITAVDVLYEDGETPNPVHVDWNATVKDGADDGGTELVVQVSMTNGGADPIQWQPDRLGVGTDAEDVQQPIASDGLEIDVAPEATVEGWASFEVPADADALTLTAVEGGDAPVVVDFEHDEALAVQGGSGSDTG